MLKNNITEIYLILLSNTLKSNFTLLGVLGFWVGFDGQNPSLAGSSFSGFSGRLKALRPADAVVKITRNLIKFCILPFVSCEVTCNNQN